jgi:nitrate/nitrite-specific signal transduction histidine kinase
MSPAPIKNQKPRSPRQVEKLLHDHLCQTLTGLSFRASVLAGKTAKVNPTLSRELKEVQALIERARRELREVLATLRQPRRAPLKAPPRGAKGRSA